MTERTFYTINSALWYANELGIPLTRADLHLLDEEARESYLSDLKQWHREQNPTEAEAWEMA